MEADPNSQQLSAKIGTLFVTTYCQLPPTVLIALNAATLCRSPSLAVRPCIIAYFCVQPHSRIVVRWHRVFG